MERKDTQSKPSKKGADREVKAALKANMARRKSQARVRAQAGVNEAQENKNNE